jgi:hypothetical protein
MTFLHEAGGKNSKRRGKIPVKFQNEKGVLEFF